MTIPEMKVYTGSGVLINTTAVPNLLLGQITNWNYNPNANYMSEITSGYVDRTFSARGTAEPTISFGCSQLSEVVDKIKMDGFPLTGGTMTVWAQKYKSGSTRETTELHRKYVVAKGMVIPSSFSWSRGSRAQCDLTAYAIWDGDNNPVVETDNVAFHASAMDSEGFVDGPIKINSTVIGGIQSVSINPGIEVMAVYGVAGAVWPTDIFVVTRQPSITIETSDFGAVDELGLDGSCIDTDKVQVYFKKLDECSETGRVADDVAEHIRFTSTKGSAQITGISTGKINTVTIEIIPAWDGTNAATQLSKTAKILIAD